jgi:hypothetical protein
VVGFPDLSVVVATETTCPGGELDAWVGTEFSGGLRLPGGAIKLPDTTGMFHPIPEGPMTIGMTVREVVSEAVVDAVAVKYSV